MVLRHSVLRRLLQVHLVGRRFRRELRPRQGCRFKRGFPLEDAVLEADAPRPERGHAEDGIAEVRAAFRRRRQLVRHMFADRLLVRQTVLAAMAEALDLPVISQNVVARDDEADIRASRELAEVAGIVPRLVEQVDGFLLLLPVLLDAARIGEIVLDETVGNLIGIRPVFRRDLVDGALPFHGTADGNGRVPVPMDVGLVAEMQGLLLFLLRAAEMITATAPAATAPCNARCACRRSSPR